MAKKKKMIVQKPFHQGSLMDELFLKRSASVAGYVLASGLIYMLLGSLFTFDNVILRIALNLALLAFANGMLYVNGLNAGVADVTHGEIVYRRLAEGREAAPKAAARCFHPFKGLLCGLAGVAPFLILCLVLAFIAQQETFVLGALPGWLSPFERQPEIGEALSYYHRPLSMGLEDYLRIVIRILLMPYTNILTTDNSLAMLWLERLSPLISLIPALCYGAGYFGGPRARAQVHTDIAADNRKRKRKAEKIRKARASQEPEQLI